MRTSSGSATFASLFKKYRLRSEIGTLSEFGDLLAQEGMVYETSLFTRWQRGNRLPRGRKLLLSILKVFFKKKGIWNFAEANLLMEASGQGYITEVEKILLSEYITGSNLKASIATVGELLKSFRIRKNLSQSELVLNMGGTDSTRLDRIEQGTEENPPREIIEDISSALSLHINEKNNLLLAGNYVPSQQEINEIRFALEDEIEKWPYSVVLYDFCWRIILINQKHLHVLGLDQSAKEKIYQDTPSALEIIFDPNFLPNIYLKGEDLKIWHNNLLRFVTHFRSLQRSIVKEKWYFDLIQKLMSNELFRSIWRKSEEKESTLISTRFGRKILVDYQGVKLNCNIFVVPFYKDPRFEIEFYNPADIDTFNYYVKRQL
jgi:transcriptional regulator with XRE-family HTH domain